MKDTCRYHLFITKTLKMNNTPFVFIVPDKHIVTHILRGMLHPDIPDHQHLFNNVKVLPSNIMDIRGYLNYRNLFLKQSAGSLDPAFSLLRSQVNPDVRLPDFPEPLLLEPWSTMTKLYELVLKHEFSIMQMNSFQLFHPVGGAYNRYDILKQYDFFVDILVMAHYEIVNRIGSNPDLKHPDHWFTTMEHDSYDKRAVFVFYTLRNQMAALLQFMEDNWPETLSDCAPIALENLFWDKLNGPKPSFLFKNIIVNNSCTYPHCTKCSNALKHLKQAAYELGINQEDLKGKFRYTKINALLEKHNIKIIENSVKNRFITMCDFNYLKQIINHR